MTPRSSLVALVAVAAGMALLAAPLTVASAWARDPGGDGHLGDAGELASQLLVTWRPGISPEGRAAAAGRVPRRPVTDRIDLLHLPSARVAATVSQALAARPEVAAVEPNRVIHLTQTPDDPEFAQQWGLRNSGQVVFGTAGRAGVDVRGPDAWRVTRGNPDVVVAVIDTGVDPLHEDLADNLWSNPGETLDGRDSDGNGYVDDVHGVNVMTGTGDIEDFSGHGSAVAGIAVAVADNGVGIAGMAPQVRLMTIKAFAVSAEGPVSRTDWILDALYYARDNGADAVNVSWGSEHDSPAIRNAVGDLGIPVVAAAGNAGVDMTSMPRPRFYPAAYDFPHLVAVASVDNRGRLSAFSNFGRDHVDLAGPGEAIRSTVPGSQYDWFDGTSFSAPYVTGAIALARSVAPYATASELVDVVARTSRVEPDLVGRTRTGGMLDAAAVVAGIQRPACRPDRLEPSSFPDVPATSVHRVGIDCIVAFRVTEGRADGTYDPAASVTRAQMASFLARVVAAAGKLPEDAPDAFTDDNGSVHEDNINRLAALGIVQGSGDGRYFPGRAVTRAQMATFLVRTHEVVTGRSRAATRDWFDDDAGGVHEPNINRARDLGLAQGLSHDRYGPDGQARRDQMATFLSRLLDAVERAGVELAR